MRNHASDLLADADTPAGAAVYLAVTLGQVRPHDVVNTPAEWRDVLAELSLLDIVLEEKRDGAYALAEVVSHSPYRSDAQRVRSLVKRSPSWCREVVSSSQWPAIEARVLRGARDSRVAGPPPARFGMQAVSTHV